MKKVLLLLAVLLFSAGTMMAQQDKAAEKAAKDAEKAAKKAAKEAQKLAEEAEQMALFEQGIQALSNKDFVLEADRVEFKRGRFAYVTPSTNFISMQGDKATIQLAFNGVVNGPNGIGGITVDGSATNVVMKTDKKGNVTLNMMVQGVAVSATVTIRMVYGTNKCTATVSPNFNSNRVSFTGYLYPSDQSNVFKGHPL
ncbi:DUF4251 domain-containing protein [Parabacteroides sp. AM08-6]|uniref:DUF4251 domain-containing protein n=1 Tax=Parabacteroides sp. AM08-6 TaxID=2292053 RepID=UPI000EFDE05C|nr:DUF4251 domain-containing protein [Parabacteroides sp. AM08-6]RHJ86514.1 DUF4251 domain-containing protein [Parabacteroides sp. AM08-6]